MLVLGAGPAAGLGPPPDPAALAGETLEFEVRWGVIPAGRATLKVRDAGEGRLSFQAEAETLAYVSTIYPVRERIESTVLLPGLQALRYRQDSKEGWGRAKESEILFDPVQGVARYFRDQEAKKSLLVPPGVQDPLSCFYAYRSLDLPDDDEVRLDVTDGKKLITGVVRVLGREEVETPAGTFRTVRIEPILEDLGGIFKKSPGARIFVWITDDEWRRPVKLQSKVVIGHFTAELTRVSHPGASPRDPG